MEAEAVNLKKQFGIFLKKKRKEANMTIEVIAELTDMSPRGYAYIECGRSDPKWSTVVKIAAVLDLDLNSYVDKAIPKKNPLSMTSGDTSARDDGAQQQIRIPLSASPSIYMT